jgi:hypothetical protein
VQDGPAPPVPPAPLPPGPELVQAEATVTTRAKRPTPRNPKSACLIEVVLWRLALFIKIAFGSSELVVTARFC